MKYIYNIITIFQLALMKYKTREYPGTDISYKMPLFLNRG